jgi:hypothetical protein
MPTSAMVCHIPTNSAVQPFDLTLFLCVQESNSTNTALRLSADLVILWALFFLTLSMFVLQEL